MLTEQHPLNRATAAQVETHARKAVKAALDFFGQNNTDLPVILVMEAPNNDAAASCLIDLRYMKVTLRVAVDYHQGFPESIWSNMGHEVAHIVLREAQALRDEVTKPDTFEYREYTRALEAATTRLERLFVRHCPDPGWESE